MARRIKPGQLNKTVTTAGAKVQLSTTSVLVKSIMIQANPGNSGDIYVGDSSVSSSVYGAVVTANNSLSLEPPSNGTAETYELDLQDFWIDSSVNGEGISIMYFYYDS